MRFLMSGETYLEGLQNFMSVYYLEELKSGSIKRAIITYGVCLMMLIGLCIITPGLRELYFWVIVFLLSMSAIMAMTIFLSVMISKKRKFENKIESVEQIYEENIIVKVNFMGESTEEIKYNYCDIKKVVESKKYLYLFLTDSLAIPFYKEDESEKIKFITLLKNRNIKVKELKK